MTYSITLYYLIIFNACTHVLQPGVLLSLSFSIDTGSELPSFIPSESFDFTPLDANSSNIFIACGSMTA